MSTTDKLKQTAGKNAQHEIERDLNVLLLQNFDDAVLLKSVNMNIAMAYRFDFINEAQAKHYYAQLPEHVVPLIQYRIIKSPTVNNPLATDAAFHNDDTKKELHTTTDPTQEDPLSQNPLMDVHHLPSSHNKNNPSYEPAPQNLYRFIEQRIILNNHSNTFSTYPSKGMPFQRGIHQSSYVVFDVETTGLDPKKHKLLEVGALKVINHHVVDAFQSLIKTDEIIPYHITKINGITNAMTHAEGIALYKVIGNFIHFIDGFPLVGQNIAFDVGFINAAMQSLGLPHIQNFTLDTARIARSKITGLKSYSLKGLSVYFNTPNLQKNDALFNAHRSIGDCVTTHQVFEALQSL